MVRPGGTVLTRLFEGFANTLLDLGLPKINEWLRNKLGPNAVIGAVTSQGRRVLLEQVTIPIGPRGILSLDKATCTLGANASKTSSLPSARLSSFEGVLRFAGPDSPTFEADVEFEETESDENAWVHGRLTISDATWTIESDAIREGHVPMNGAARLIVTSAAWSLEDGELHTGTAEVGFSGGGRLNNDDSAGTIATASLKAKDARARHFFDAIAALADTALPIAFPDALGDPLLSGEVTWRDSKATCKANIDSDAFRLSVEGTGSEIAIDATVKGDISVAKMVALGLQQRVPSSADLGAGVEHLAVDLKIGGSPKKPIMTGRLRAPALRVLPNFSVRDVDIELKTENEGFIATGGVELETPPLTQASGELRMSFDPELTIRGGVILDTPRSALKIEPLLFSKGRVDGTKLSGSLAVADAIAAGLFPFDIHPHPTRSSAFVGELTIDGTPADLALDGKISARRLEVAIASRADVPPFVFEDVAGHVHVTRTEFAYRDFTGRGYGADLHAHGKVPFHDSPEAKEDRLVIKIDHANAWLADALARLATGGVRVRRERRGERRHPDEMWIPEGATLVGEARLDNAMKLTADVALEHGADTALLANIVLSPAPDSMLDGSRIFGKLGIADALLAGAFDTTMRPLPEPGHTARIDATLKGRFDDAVLSGTATAKLVHVAMPSSPAVPVFVITNLATTFRIDRQKIVWHKLVADAYGGTVNSSGMIGYSEKFTGLRSAAEWRDIDVTLLPKAASFVKGSLAGRMRFDRAGLDSPQNPILGSGDLVLSSPEYPVLLQSAPMLSRYGLPPPGPVGTGSLTLRIHLLAHGWRLSDVTASVEDCLMTGGIDVSFDAQLQGRFVLNFGERYLRKSRLLTIPAVFAQNVDLPIHIAGILSKPMVQTDVASTLGRLAINNRVTGMLDGAVEELSSLFGVGSRSSSRTVAAMPIEPEPAPAPEEQDFSNLDEDAIVKEMIAKGADWDEIEWRLDEIRRKRPRFRVE